MLHSSTRPRPQHSSRPVSGRTGWLCTRCKVAAPEFAASSRGPQQHEQGGHSWGAGSAYDEELQDSQPGSSLNSSWRSSSSNSNTSSADESSSRPAGWPWSLWSPASSSIGSSSKTARFSRYSHAVSRSPSLLEQSAAAVSKQHVRRGLLPRGGPHNIKRTVSTPGGSFGPSAAAVGAAVGAGAAVSAYSGSLAASSISSTSSSWDESAAALRNIDESWEDDSSSSSGNSGSNDTTQLFLYDLMPPAAVKAVTAADDDSTSCSSSSRLALLLGDTYPHTLASEGTQNGSSSSSALLPSQEDVLLPQRLTRRQQWGRSPSEAADGSQASSHTVPLPNASALQRSLKAVGPHGQPSSSSSSSSAGVSPVSSGSSSPGSSGEDADWLTAVLSVSTSRLSSHSNAVLTNSLRRLASLRSASGGMAPAAVEGAEGLVDSIRARFGSFQLQQFEEVALQLAQLGYQPDAEWMAAFERSSMAVLPGGSPRLLSRLLLSRSKLGGSVSSEWCAACCKHMADAPHKLSVSSWVNALYALVRLKHTPSRQLQATFFSATAERLDDISPELLTHLVWSLSRLKLTPSAVWWRSLVTATASVEKPFSHAQLASLVHSVALWAEPGGISAQDVQRLVDMLLVEIHEHLAVLQPAELTIVVWSLGSLIAARKLRPDQQMLDEVLAAIQGQLPRLSPTQCSNLCWGLAKLGHRLSDSFAEALLLEVQAQLAGFSDSNLCSVLWALAKLQLVPLAPFRHELWAELQHRVKNLSLQDLSTLLWALAQLQLQPPEDVVCELCERSWPCIPECDVTQLTIIVWALGRLQARPGRDFLEAAEAASMQVLPSAGLTQLVNLVWGLSRLRNPAGCQDNLSPHSLSFQDTSAPECYSFSPAWQAPCLRELRLRCVCAGVDVDCSQLVGMLRELGVAGLAEDAAAVADRLFAEQEDDAYCSLQFQPGCR